MANHDNESFDVERIVSHKGSARNKNKLTFRVAWKNYPGEDTQTPYSNLRNNIKLHEYLRTKGMQNLIPKGFKTQ